jgi:hypothetical protein
MIRRIVLVIMCLLYAGIIARKEEEVVISMNKTQLETKSKFIYVSTSEGIISHLQQLQNVWLYAQMANRGILMPGFYSPHYKGVKIVHMCDLFALPSNIVCIHNLTSKAILESYNCLYTKGQRQREWKEDVKLVSFTSDINFKEVECFAGNAHIFNEGTLAKYEAKVKDRFLNTPFFSKKYQAMFQQIRDFFKLSDDNYMTVHWRRGSDHLRYRCGHDDFSANCANVTDFVDIVQSEVSHHTKDTNQQMFVYIATNEEDPKILSYLDEHGFRVMHNIVQHFTKQNLKFTPVDSFMIELMLMCDAKYFMYWGSRSSIEKFFTRKFCRNSLLFPDKVTVQNGSKI